MKLPNMHPLKPLGDLPAPFGNGEPQRNTHGNREAWLTEASRLLAEHVFASHGYTVPTNLRVSCSWPSHGGLAPKRRVMGQAWHETCSADGHYEIVISQNVDDPLNVIAVLTHELVHVVVGFGCGHRGPFNSPLTKSVVADSI